MREELESLFTTMAISYHQFLSLLLESKKISDRDMEILGNLSRPFFKTLNTIVGVFPETKNELTNEEIKKNNNEEKIEKMTDFHNKV